MSSAFHFNAVVVKWEGFGPVNRFNQTRLVAVVTPSGRPKSDRNRYAIDVLGGVFVLSRCF